MPQVSIVLPVYNGEQYLHESIDSILAQTFTDWELIIVDDCSTDQSPEIINRYINMDNRIRVYRNEVNQKLPRSLNIGFENTLGEYLTWTSDDNMYLPEALEEMVSYLDKYDDVPMVVGEMAIFNDAVADEKILSYDSKEIYVHNCVGACFMYRRSVLNKVGGYNPERFLVEDYDYWLRVLFECGDIEHVNRCLYRYRYHDTSLTTTRKRDVQIQLAKLLTDYSEKIIMRLKDDQKWLVCLYYEMIELGEVVEELSNKLKDVVPLIKGDKLFDDDKSYVIYGAGEYGSNARASLADNAIAYVDGNTNIVGSFKDGLKILGTDKLPELYKDYHIMIAADAKKLFVMMERLEELEIHEFCTWINYRYNS